MRASSGMWTSLFGILLVVGPYAASFFLPVLAIPVRDQPAWDRIRVESARRGAALGEITGAPPPVVVLGHQAFRMWPEGGWVHTVAWTANPFVWVGCLLLLMRWWRAAAVLGVVALGLGSVMAILDVTGNPEAEIRWSVTDYRVGYWLWLASMALLAAAGAVGWLGRRSRSQGSAPPNEALQQSGGA